jgi:PKD repeat protein
MPLLLVALWLSACEGDKDGKDPGVDDTDPGAAPAVVIRAPEAGAVLNTPEAITLTGDADDPEDGPLDGAALAWSSDRDGPLGTGGQLVVELSLGEHVITLEGTDSDGLVGRDTVAIEVSSVNQAPLPVILTPVDGAYAREGETVQLTGEATDPEDGAVAGPGLVWTSSLAGLLGSGASLDATGLALGDHLIVLSAIDSQGLGASTAVTLHVVAVGVDTPPTAQIDAPTSGAAFVVGDAVRFEGRADDLEDGPLPAGALTWSSSVDGALGAGSPLERRDLSAGVHTITATASDSAGQPGADSVTITVNAPGGNQPPTAEIFEPAANTTVTAGSPVRLAGAGDDPEDGPLRDGALAWSSSRDGALGTGSPLDVTTLSAGAHTLQLLATDSAGAQGVASTTLYVLAPNTPPVVTILGPPDGTQVTAGTTVRFQGAATDAEDGALTGASLLWQSNLSGAFGTGEDRPFASLTAGAHQITLTAVDNQGGIGTDTIRLVVDPAAAPLPPIASLSGASIAYVGLPWTADGSASSDPDGSVTTWAFDWGDGSAVTRGGAATASHTFAAPGLLDVTLTVTDDAGLTDAATLQVDVQIPVRAPVVVDDDLWPLGDFCDLALDAADRPHVLYGNLGHSQVWYAFERGGAWVHELVDGPGFGVGGEADGGGGLVLDGAGTPHAAWLIDGGVHYGTRTNGVWSVEVVTTSAEPNDQVAIALDPSRQSRPTVAWTDAGTDHLTVGWRTGPGAWSTQTWANPALTSGRFRGGMAFTAGGLALLTTGTYESGVVSWQQAAGFSGYQQVWDDPSYSSYRVPLVLDLRSQPMLAWDQGVERQLAGVWTHEAVANSPLDDLDIAWDLANDQPIAVFRNAQGNVEIVHPDGRAYWTWEYQGVMDSGTDPGLAVASNGDVRACFFRSGNLVVY